MIDFKELLVLRCSRAPEISSFSVADCVASLIHMLTSSRRKQHCNKNRAAVGLCVFYSIIPLYSLFSCTS